MMKACITTFLLVFNLTCIYGQNNLNDTITKFEADCSEPIVPEDSNTEEFTLLKLSTDDNLATLNFEIIANCAQQKQGVVSIQSDTLIILETDVTITRSTTYEAADSAGLMIEITEETHIAELAFCDCLMNFYYELSTSLDAINFLTFHERTFQLNRTK